MIFEVQYLIIYCIDKTIFTNICIFETAKLILLNAQNLVPMNIIENTVCCIHMYIDSVKFHFWPWFSNSFLSSFRRVFSASIDVNSRWWLLRISKHLSDSMKENSRLKPSSSHLPKHRNYNNLSSIPLFLISPSHFPLSFSLFLFLYFTEREKEIGGG